MLIGRAQAANTGGAADVVTLSGETISDTDLTNSRTVTATVIVDADGNMYKKENTTTTQIDTSTDWVRPTSSASSYHVRFSKSLLGDNPDIGTEGSWLAVTVDREYGFQVTTDDTQHRDTSLTVELSDDGGSTIVESGTYSITARRGTPP